MIDSFSGEYDFLSNFHPAVVEYEGMIYPTSEHAFQAAKTADLNWRKQVRDCDTPGKAKRMGKKVPLRGDWEQVKIGIMRDVLRIKFSDPTLRDKLLATSGEQLIEGNTWRDTFWGVCQGKGQNWLGKLLMELRQELRQKE